jgi:uncharacterized protein YdhG (YjbR/CyaY superfamily)
MDRSVEDYIAAIPADRGPAFDKVFTVLRAACPEADVELSYGLPTLSIDQRRLHVGVWAHGVSLYGWRRSGDAGLSERHPELIHGKGTIRLRDGKGLSDEELQALARAVLHG